MQITAATLRNIASMPARAISSMLLILAEQVEAEEAKRANQRDRTRKSRARNVTVTAQERDEACDTPALSLSPTPPNSNPSPKENPPKGGQKKAQFSEAFLAFWAVYPRRDGANPKEPASVRFEAAVKAGDDPEAIIGGAQRYATEQTRLGKAGTEFVAQAMTWLNQRCWRDYPEVLEPARVGTDGKIYVFRIDRQWDWCAARHKQEHGKAPPTDKDGGWRFPTAWLEPEKPTTAELVEAVAHIPEFLDQRKTA